MRHGYLYYVAAVLLLSEFLLVVILDKAVDYLWLDCAAWAVWAVSIVLLFTPMYVLRTRGGVPKGKSYVETRRLVDTSIYAAVRHPQYLGWLLMYLAVLLFNPHWPQGIAGLAGMVCLCFIAAQEDKRLIAKFGVPYHFYKASVPGLNLPAGVIRLLRRRGPA